jgi:nucleotide-binding universal stress UspA family protein
MQEVIPMSAVKKILLATNFSAASTAAFHESLYLCRTFGASLYILHVFEYTSGSPTESGGLLFELDALYKNAKLSLDILIDTARQNAVPCEGTITNGISHQAILDSLSSQSCDLVVLGTRAIHGFERLVFGSTAEAVIRHSRSSVLTIGPKAGESKVGDFPQHGIAVFATDFHDATRKTIALAALFARTLRLSLHCLHVLPRVLDGHNPPVLQVTTEALKHLAARVATEVKTLVCAVTYGSQISNAVVDYARKHDARLIVLGVRRASLVASHVPAHIAFRIITEGTCPVLTLAYPVNLT